MKYLLKLHEYIACIILYLMIISIGNYLLKSKIIEFRIDWFKYIYYYGLGIVSYYPCNYILNHKKIK